MVYPKSSKRTDHYLAADLILRYMAVTLSRSCDLSQYEMRAGPVEGAGGATLMLRSDAVAGVNAESLFARPGVATELPDLEVPRLEVLRPLIKEA